MTPDDRALARIEALRGFLAQDPADAFSAYALAMELAKSPTTHPEALTLYEGLQRRSPDYLPAYYQHALLLGRIGHDEEARETIRKGVAEAERQGEGHTRDELKALLDTL